MSRVCPDAMATAMQEGSSSGAKRKRGSRKGKQTQQKQKNTESEIIETDTNIIEFEFFETDAFEFSPVKDANDNEAEDVLDRIFDAAKSGKSKDLSKLIFNSHFDEEDKTIVNLQSTNKETNLEHSRKRKSTPGFTRLQPSKKQCRETVDFKNVINTLVQGSSDGATSDTSVKGPKEHLSKSSADDSDAQPEKTPNENGSGQTKSVEDGTKDSVIDPSKKPNTAEGTKDSIIAPSEKAIAAKETKNFGRDVSEKTNAAKGTKDSVSDVSDAAKGTKDSVSDVSEEPSAAKGTKYSGRDVSKKCYMAKGTKVPGRDVPEKAKSSKLPMLKIGPIHPNMPVLIPVSAPFGLIPTGTQAVNPPVTTTTPPSGRPLKLPDNFYQYMSNKPKANTSKTTEGVEIVSEKSKVTVKSSSSVLPNFQQPPANENPQQQQQRAVIDFSALTKAVAQTIENRLGINEESDIKLVLFCNKKPIESFSILKNNPKPPSEKEAKRLKLNKAAFDNLVFSEPNASIKTAQKNRSDESNEAVNTYLLRNDVKGKAAPAETVVGGKVPCSAKVEESKGIKIIYDVSSVATTLAEHDANDRNQERRNAKENLKKDTMDQQPAAQRKTLPEDCGKGLEQKSNKQMDVSKRQTVDSGLAGLKKTLIPIAPKPGTSQEPQIEPGYVDDAPYVKFMRIEQGRCLNLDLCKQENPSDIVGRVVTQSLKPANQINVRVVKENRNESDLEATTLKSDDPMKDDEENGLVINESVEEEDAKEDSQGENGCETTKGKEKNKFPYECELCFRLFREKRYLSKHFLRVHKIPYNDQVALGMIEESMPKSSITKQETKKQNEMLFQELLSNKAEELEQAKAEGEAKMNDIDDPLSDSEEAFADILLQRASLISKLRDQQGWGYDADSPYQLTARVGDLQSLARKEKELGDYEIEPVFVCEHCGKFYRARKSLKDHFDREHLTAPDQEPMYIFIATNSFNCPICFGTFPDPYQLVAHSKEHAMANILNCVLCGKTYSSVYVLRRHIDSVHQYIRPRPYKCGFCPYAAANRWHLKEHNRKHTGEQPFKCPGCDKTFAHQGTMNRHCKSKHGILPGEPKRLFYPEDVPEAHLSRIREINYTPPDKDIDQSKLHVNSGSENSTKYLSLVPVGPVISLKDLKKGGFPDKQRQTPPIEEPVNEETTNALEPEYMSKLPCDSLDTPSEGNSREREKLQSGDPLPNEAETPLEEEKPQLEDLLQNEGEKNDQETESEFVDFKSFDIKLEVPDSPKSIENEESASTRGLINQEQAPPEYIAAGSLASKSAGTRNQTSQTSLVNSEPLPSNPHRTRSKTRPVHIVVKEEPLDDSYN